MTCAACPAALLCMSGRTLVYLVVGKTGEYSDRREWYVKVCTSDQQASELANNAQKWCANLKATAGDYEAQEHAKENPYDPNCRIDYTGTEYYVCPVSFDGGVM